MSKSSKTGAPKAFISYAWKNQAIAKQLQQNLQRDGVDVFVDYEKIVGGDSLPARISSALDWCDTIILLWSGEAAQSYWVAQEWESAFQLQKRIIPCLLDGATLPALLRGRLYLDFSSYAAGYRQLCRTLGVKPATDQPASTPPLTEPAPRQHVDLSGSNQLLWQAAPQVADPDPPKAEPVKQKSPEAPEGMVLIPAGAFMMGSDDGDSDEKPVHEVYVDAFYLDQHEVTVAKFREFVNVNGYKTDAEKEGFSYIWNGTEWEKKEGINWRHNAEGKISADNYPVINVSWNDATAYAKWAKKRLPTEAEWEYAARSGSKGYKYSWGNGSPTGKKGGNIADEAGKRVFSSWTIWEGYDDGFAYTAPVGSFDPNEFGLYDMTGNVWEWCTDWYAEDYYSKSPKQNPKGPTTGEQRVLRGGSWFDNPHYVRCANRFRNYPSVRSGNVGFRCAQDTR